MRIYTLSYQLKALAEEKWKRKSNLLFSLELEHCFAFTLVNLYQWPQFLRPLVLNWAIPTAYLILQTAYCRTYIVTYVNFHNTFILIYQSIYLSIYLLSIYHLSIASMSLENPDLYSIHILVLKWFLFAITPSSVWVCVYVCLCEHACTCKLSATRSIHAYFK
jgi:hypothetical protein